MVNDASESAVGSTLYQVPSTGNLEVIGYYSKKLTPPEEKRPMRTKELLAMAYGIKAFEYYLDGCHFDVVTDHKSLLYLYKEHLKTALDVKLTNIHYYLNQFSFTIIDRPGADEWMASADYLSRLPISTVAEL